jgi:excisionase family DNA binding protein
MNNQIDIIPRLMTASEAARYLAISERTLWNLTHTKKISSVRIGKRAVRYDLHDLNTFISTAKETNQRQVDE